MSRTIPFPPPYYLAAPGQFFDQWGDVSVAASGNLQTVASFTMPPRMVGVLLGVAFEAADLTGWFWGRWNLEVGGVIDRNLQDVDGMVARITEPLAVYRVLRPAELIRVMVTNRNSTQSFQFAARIFGYYQEVAKPLVSGSAFTLQRGG